MICGDLDTIHVLNGDALFERIADQLAGSIIVMRECLVDGDVSGATAAEFYKRRAAFISDTYKGATREDYYSRVIPQIELLSTIPDRSKVILWFEEDLFCQVNMWYVLYRLSILEGGIQVNLVRPPAISPFSFGHLSQDQLEEAYRSQLEITNYKLWGGLWPAYVVNDFGALQDIATDLNEIYPFLLPAMSAHIDRQSTETRQGRPFVAIKEIISLLGISDIGPVFSKFTEEQAIYGYGDLQVQRLINEVVATL